MTVTHALVPIDGSDVSFRALSFGADLAAAFEADLDAVYFTPTEDDDPDHVIDRAERILDPVPVETALEVAPDLDLDFRPADSLGENVLELVSERGYDHVVLGHEEPPGPVERALLGSVPQTVIRSERVRVTVVP